MASKGSIVWETRKTDDNWKKIQERTFTNWFNDRLRGNLRVAKKQVSVLHHNNLFRVCIKFVHKLLVL